MTSAILNDEINQDMKEYYDARLNKSEMKDWENKLVYCDINERKTDRFGDSNLVFRGRTNRNHKTPNKYNKHDLHVSPGDVIRILKAKAEGKFPHEIWEMYIFDYKECTESTIAYVCRLHNSYKFETFFEGQTENYADFWSYFDIDYKEFKELSHKKELENRKSSLNVPVKNVDNTRLKIIDSKLSPGVCIYDKFKEDIIVEACTGNKQITEYIIVAAWRLLGGDNKLFSELRDDHAKFFGESLE